MIHSNVFLQSLSYELPPNVVTTESLYERLSPTLKRLRIPGSWLASLSGVRERRLWNPETTLAESAAMAARKAVADSGIDPKDIGCLVCTSVSREFIEPSLACMVHYNLGLPQTTMSFDISNACLAFLTGVSQMAQMIEQRLIKAALIVDSECSRRVVESTLQRMTQPGIDLREFTKQFAGLTLGSGAVAAVITNESLQTTNHRIVGQVSLADTSYCRHCIGSYQEIVTEQTSLMKAGIDLATKTWTLANSSFGWTRDNVQQFVCHQVGARHLQLLFEALGLDKSKAFQTFPFLGNVGPASLPLTLALAAEKGLFSTRDRIGLMGIGSGLNCAMMEIVW